MPQPPSIFDAGPQTLPVPSYLSNYIQPTFAHGLRIWWAFFWPTTLISAILGAAIDLGLRVIYEHTNIPADVIGPLMRFAPYVISYVVALFIMEYILRKNFRHFRIGLVSSGVSANAQLCPPLLPALCESGGPIRGELCCIGSSLLSWPQFRSACFSESSREFRQRKSLYGLW
jgi:hypothetical protein